MKPFCNPIFGPNRFAVPLTLFLAFLFFGLSACGAERPFWDDFPRIVQIGDPEIAIEANANVVLSGIADDPCWGTFSQHDRVLGGKASLERLHQAGIKVLSWFEGFGTTQENIAQLKKNPDGSWVRNQREPSHLQTFNSHWGWHSFDGTGEMRWIGISNYFLDDPAVRPWTRTDSRYGCPPMIYPDGRIAEGYIGIEGNADPDRLFGPEVDPRTSRVLDAGCSKDVLGRVFFEYDYNREVNRIDPATKQPRGPLTGLLKIDDAPLGPPDPGFTPEEWQTVRKAGYTGLFSAGKDTACPIWIEYLKASLRQALDAGIDGLWVDNFSPWDSFNAFPNAKAFGEWSVAGFRKYLAREREAIGRDVLREIDLETFDVRAYLRDRCKEWGGVPENLNDGRWRDPRWQDDPIWRAYLIYKRQTGTTALTNYYETIKKMAAEAGKPDFLVSGNDIPVYSLGWVRGNLDMVSTELNWGWGLTSGPRGFLPPPLGSYVPVYRLGREHAKSRFVNVWMYVPEEQIGKPNIAKVLYYQGLANHALPMPQIGKVTAGNLETDAGFYDFVRRVEPVFKDRRPLDGKIGIYYSSSSQLLEMLPGGFREHASQPHSFAFWGWGTALCNRQVPWKAVPEWKLSPAALAELDLLILPNVEVIGEAELKTLQRWVIGGGRLIVTGNFGKRLGEDGNFALRTDREALIFTDKNALRVLGEGKILAQDDDIGFAYYFKEKERHEAMLVLEKQLGRIADEKTLYPYVVPGENFPSGVDLTLHRDERRLFLDINNTRIDLASDTIAPSGPIRLTLLLPEEWNGKELDIDLLAPDAETKIVSSRREGGRFELELSNVPVYCSVVLEVEDR